MKKTHALNINNLFKEVPIEGLKLNYEYNLFNHIKKAKGIKNKFYEVESALKNSLERSKYGVSSHDAWSLGDYILISIANGLRILARDAHGWPGTSEFPKFEDWQMKLIEVADMLEGSIWDEDKDDREFSKYLTVKNIYGAESEETNAAYKKWIESLEERRKQNKEKRREAFLWIADHCDELWD